jgi:hypothetical protein
VTAGNPIVISWAPQSGATYVVDVSANAGCTSPTTIETAAPTVMIPTTPSVNATYCVAIRAVKNPACPSEPVTLLVSVVSPPAAFSVVVPAPAIVVNVGEPLPPTASITLRNTGGSPGSVTFTGAASFFVPSPAAAGNVAAGSDVVVTLVFDPALSSTVGLKSGVLGATWFGGSLEAPVLVNVLEPASAPESGARLMYSGSNIFRFSGSPNANPPSQTATILNTGTGAAVLAPRIAPEGAWLQVSGDFSTPLAPGAERSFQVSVDRGKKPEGSPAVISTNLVFYAEGEPGENAAYGQVFDEVLPGPVSGANRPNLAPDQFSVILPSAVTAPGIGASFVSGAWIRNQGPTNVVIDLYFTPDGVNGQTDGSVKKNSLVLAPYSTYSLSDLLAGLFVVEGVSGQVEIRSTGLSQLSIRSTTDSIHYTADGAIVRYGAEIPVILSGQGVQASGAEKGPSGLATGDVFAILTGLRDPEAGFRTNIILSETSGKSASVRVSLYNVDGKLTGQKSVSLLPYSKKQINASDRDLFPAGVRFEGGTAEVVSEGGAGSVAAFATIIDNLSGSFAARTGELFLTTSPDGSARKVSAPNAVVPSFLPAAVRASALNESFYTTRVGFANLSRNPVKITLTYIPDKGVTGDPVVREVTIPARAEGPRAVVYSDIISEQFNITNDTRGMVRLDGNLSPIAVASETSTPIDLADSSKGRSLSAVNPAPGKPLTEEFGVFSRDSSEAVGTTASGSTHPVSSFPAVEDGVGFRTNLILAEVAGETAEVVVRVMAPSQGGALLGEKTFTLEPFQRLQQNRIVRDVLGIHETPIRTEFKDLELKVEAVSGNGRVLALVTRIDNNPASKRADIFTLGGTVTSAPVSFGD